MQCNIIFICNFLNLHIIPSYAATNIVEKSLIIYNKHMVIKMDNQRGG